MTRVKPSTLENCFEASQVKIHGHFPLLLNDDNIQEVEDDVLDCIRVAGLHLSQSAFRTLFILPVTETVEDPVSDIENGILKTYLLNEADEPEAEILLPGFTS
ncbi:hypothetical protein L211DRAFT_844829 [Terfezia boudieri ATCC MYA-4762]|uniref:Uncharacterized protein n=1 Tax=Terfezia boudieri ATCC MYA-4762 TaxID=1051890 RepID=A0A3N4MCP2_9PEZI|nr:hypothetical protein L211DRAFT_844829 [Terfezia boudieri ATCC MYA-4762]